METDKILKRSKSSQITINIILITKLIILITCYIEKCETSTLVTLTTFLYGITVFVFIFRESFNIFDNFGSELISLVNILNFIYYICLKSPQMFIANYIYVFHVSQQNNKIHYPFEFIMKISINFFWRIFSVTYVNIFDFLILLTFDIIIYIKHKEGILIKQKYEENNDIIKMIIDQYLTGILIVSEEKEILKIKFINKIASNILNINENCYNDIILNNLFKSFEEVTPEKLQENQANLYDKLISVKFNETQDISLIKYNINGNVVFIKFNKWINFENKNIMIISLESIEDERKLIQNNLMKNLKSQFILTISHELNNPMNGLVNYCEKLISEEIETKKRFYVEKIKRFKYYIRFFIQNIIFSTKIMLKEKIKQNPKNLNFSHILKKILNKFHNFIREKDINYESFIKNTTNIVIFNDYQNIKFLLKNALMYLILKVNRKTNIIIQSEVEEFNKNIILSFREFRKSNKTNNLGELNSSKSVDRSFSEDLPIKDTVKSLEMIQEILKILSEEMKIKINFSLNSVTLTIPFLIIEYDKESDISEYSLESETNKSFNFSILQRELGCSRFNNSLVNHSMANHFNFSYSNSQERIITQYTQEGNKSYEEEKEKRANKRNNSNIVKSNMKLSVLSSRQYNKRTTFNQHNYNIIINDKLVNDEDLTQNYKQIRIQNIEKSCNYSPGENNNRPEINVIDEEPYINEDEGNISLSRSPTFLSKLTSARVQKSENKERNTLAISDRITFTEENVDSPIRSRLRSSKVVDMALDSNLKRKIRASNTIQLKRNSYKDQLDDKEILIINNNIEVVPAKKRASKRNLSVIQRKKDLQLIGKKITINTFFEKCKCNRILVVDDEPFNIKAIKFMLKSFKISADECYNGEECVQKIQEQEKKTCCSRRYSLIFMDVMMPILDGIEAARKLNELFQKKLVHELNIIIISAHDLEDVIDRIRPISLVKDFVPKPISKTKIQELLNKYYYDLH